MNVHRIAMARKDSSGLCAPDSPLPSIAPPAELCNPRGERHELVVRYLPAKRLVEIRLIEVLSDGSKRPTDNGLLLRLRELGPVARVLLDIQRAVSTDPSRDESRY